MSGISERDGNAPLGTAGPSTLLRFPLSNQMPHAPPFLPPYKKRRWKRNPRQSNLRCLKSENWLETKCWGHAGIDASYIPLFPTTTRHQSTYFSRQRRKNASSTTMGIEMPTFLIPCMIPEAKKNEYWGRPGPASRCNPPFPT